MLPRRKEKRNEDRNVEINLLHEILAQDMISVENPTTRSFIRIN
jgi:hypothetical protein